MLKDEDTLPEPASEREIRRILGDAEVAKRKDRPVIVYCEGGERSSKAVAALKRQGFARVVNLTGGLRAWQQAGLPVEK